MAGGKDEPNIKSKFVITDPRFYNRQTQAFGDWTKRRGDWLDTFRKWKSGFDADTPAFKENLDRENDYLKYIRDGGFANSLADLRTREHQGDIAAKENILDFAGGSTDRARLGTGVSSSADFARRLKVGSRIESDFAGRDTARERGDLGWVNQLKLGTMGMINKNIEALNNRTLLPAQLSDAHLGAMIDQLGKLGAMTQYGATPVFWEDRNIMQHLGDAMEGGAQTYYGNGGMGTAAALNGRNQAAAAAPAGGQIGAQTSNMTWNTPYSQTAYGYDAPAGWGGSTGAGIDWGEVATMAA